jgi:protocatechuate 3,4-dioxygenase beta subunit
MRSAAILVILCVWPMCAAAQVRDQPRSPVRDNAPPSTGSASIVGTTVTDTEPARPLRRVIVTVNSADQTVRKATVTDDNGRFAVTGLPAGRYYVTATKRGWVRAAYGAKTPDQGGALLTLTDAQRVPMSLRLLRGAVITGLIVDDNGLSPASTFVSAVRYSQFGVEKRLVPAGSTRGGTDERGQYRIYDLPPGDYYILVSPSGNGPFRQGSDLHLTSDVDVQEAVSAIQNGAGSPIADVPQRSVTVAPVFYPGVHNVAQAMPVTVRAGEERGGVDFVVPHVASVHVEGTISGLDGMPANNALVMLVNTDRDTFSFGSDLMRSSRTDQKGQFSFTEIRPGSYVLSARSAAPAGWALVDLDVQGEDVRGMSLAMQEAFTISGTVRFEGTANAPPFTNVRVSLTPEPAALVISSSSNIGGNSTNADGRFTITGVTPGRYRLTAYVPGPRPTWVLRTSLLGGQEALDTFIDVRQEMADASVVFTDQLTELSGHAGPNSTVVLFSTNQTQWFQQSARVRTARAATDGSYTMPTISPGEYFVTAVDEIQPGQWFDPAYLQGLTTNSTKITIAEGEKKTLDIRTGGGG